MKSRYVIMAGLALAAMVALLTSPAEAIPVFARKYGFTCTMCHSNYPRLNDYGVRYRENGYQLPGAENYERTVLESPPPIAFRTMVGYDVDDFKNSDIEDVNQFEVDGLDVLSGGLFRRNIGYIMVYPPEIAGSRGVAAQTGTVEMANVIFSNLKTTWLNIRAGRMEPAYVAFSNARRLSVSPYEIYDFSLGEGLFFGQTQSGIEFSGYGRNGWKYAAGWMDGAENNNSDDAPADFYLRGVKVIGHGEGQTAGQRIGATAYFGRARQGLDERKSLHRFGLDASLNFNRWNFDLLYLKGRDNGVLIEDEVPTREDVDFSGGFAQALFMPSIKLVGFTRYDWVNSPEEAGIGDIKRWTIGARYYFEDNIALHIEYSHRTEDSIIAGEGNPTESFFTTRLDFAF